MSRSGKRPPSPSARTGGEAFHSGHRGKLRRRRSAEIDDLDQPIEAEAGIGAIDQLDPSSDHVRSLAALLVRCYTVLMGAVQ